MLQDHAEPAKKMGALSAPDVDRTALFFET